ncbi:MAG: hypothetical protein WC661_22125 [Opitutaceae bacterium]|jgi:hypothetical protein
MSAEHISIMSNCTASILGALNYGLDGKNGVVAVHASKNGLRITLNGRTMAKGKTPTELDVNFRAAQEQARQSPHK